MDWKIILVALFVVLALIALTIKAMPKAARTREDIEEEREREQEITASVGRWILMFFVSTIPLLNLIVFFALAFPKYDRDKTMKNWARFNLLFYLLVAIITTVSVVLMFTVFKDQLMPYLAPYIQQ